MGMKVVVASTCLQPLLPQSPSSATIFHVSAPQRTATTSSTVICWNRDHHPSPFFGSGTGGTLSRSTSFQRHFPPIRRAVRATADAFFFATDPDDDDFIRKLQHLAKPQHASGSEMGTCSFDHAMSIGMVKKHQEEEEEMETVCCSAKKAFSSMVFMIRELQSYTLQLRQLLFYEDVQGIMCRVHSEMGSSFCWLFHRIFSCTPTLMLSLMLLLANFTVHSLSLAVPLTPPPSIHHTVSLDHTSVLIRKVKPVSEGRRPASVEEEARAWKRIVEEAASMQAATRHEALMDEETLLRFVSPLTVEIEGDGEYVEYRKTEVMYKAALEEEPHNSLLLSNYAHFLYQVLHDLNRAEYYFKRSVEVKPADAEALSRYANFLWTARNDLGAAEETFLEAIAADPGNTSHAANYAHFLWNTGGEDTCYPLDDDNDQL